MANNQFYIQDVDDFGLAINAAVRMYRRDPDDDTLATLCETFTAFMPYIDNRTLICAIRDFQPESVETWWRKEEKESGPEAFRKLRETAMMEYVNRTLKEKNYKTDYLLIRTGQDMETIADGYHKGCFETQEEFLTWAEANCNAEKAIGWNGVTDQIPIPESYLPHFNLISLRAAEYAYGRHTYVPDSIAAFVKVNLDLITKETAKKICEAIEGDFSNSCWFSMKTKMKEKFGDEIFS